MSAINYTSLYISNLNLRSFTEKLSPWLIAIGLVIALGLVGSMDYEDEIRFAALKCNQQYGEQAHFVEIDGNWQCQAKGDSHA